MHQSAPDYKDFAAYDGYIANMEPELGYTEIYRVIVPLELLTQHTTSHLHTDLHTELQPHTGIVRVRWNLLQTILLLND